MNEVAPNFWRATARFGFMERPDIPVLLNRHARKTTPLTLTMWPTTSATARSSPATTDGTAKWQEALYIAMERNSVHVSDFFRLPNDSVVVIGRQVAI